MPTVWYVIAGGVAGTLARWWLQDWIQAATPGAFPAGTLAVNLLGSFVLGAVTRLGLGSTLLSPEIRAGLTVGLCGAFTTMSTFGYETFRLLGDGDWWRAALYMGGTLVGCVAAVALGTAAAASLL